jgi:NDP-sugar pyrophosphorylase family protein
VGGVSEDLGRKPNNPEYMSKVVILLGSPANSTLFRPLSLDIPRPLFPVAGKSIIYHHIRACAAIEDLQEIILIGSSLSMDFIGSAF